MNYGIASAIVALAMLTCGCSAPPKPTSTGVLDRSLDSGNWPWPSAETATVECWGDGTPGKSHHFSVLVKSRRMAPARMVINMLSPKMRVEENVFDFPSTLYQEARRICGETRERHLGSEDES